MPEEEGLEEGGGRASASPAVTGPSVKIESGRNGRVSATLTFQVPEGVNAQPLLRQVATLLRASFAGNIDQGGNPPFAPLKKRTLRQKQLHGYSASPLIRSRLLRNSLVQSNTTGNVNSVRAGASTLTIGTNVPYAAVHQEGGGNGIPARPFVVVRPEDEAAIAGLVARFNQSLRGDIGQGEEGEAHGKQALPPNPTSSSPMSSSPMARGTGRMPPVEE